jgi:hypothetical protein
MYSCGHNNSKYPKDSDFPFICYECTIKYYEKNTPINDAISLYFPSIFMFQNTSKTITSYKQKAYGHFLRSSRLNYLTKPMIIIEGLSKIVDPRFFIILKDYPDDKFSQELDKFNKLGACEGLEYDSSVTLINLEIGEPSK